MKFFVFKIDRTTLKSQGKTQEIPKWRVIFFSLKAFFGNIHSIDKSCYGLVRLWSCQIMLWFCQIFFWWSPWWEMTKRVNFGLYFLFNSQIWCCKLWSIMAEKIFWEIFLKNVETARGITISCWDIQLECLIIFFKKIGC